MTPPADTPPASDPPTHRWRRRVALGALPSAAILYVALAGLTVAPGQAVITTHFGRNARVLTAPGFYLDWPAPIGRAILIDTARHATQSAVLDVTTSDGQHRRIQAYAIWRIPPSEPAIRLFARAAASPTANPAALVQSLLDTALAARAAATDADALLAMNQSLQSDLSGKARAAYGIEIEQAGLTQLTLPQFAIDAEAEEARARRQAEAANRLAQAQAQAAEIRAEAERDARIALAEAQVEAASIEAAARKQAADIEGRAYNADPDLYQMLRSLDTLSTMVGPSTRLVLRTDAAPFNVLVQGPPQESTTK